MTPIEAVALLDAKFRSGNAIPIDSCRISRVEYRQLVDALAQRPEEQQSKWKKHDDVPNIRAQNLYHAYLDQPIVTRLPDGSWWEHPPLGLPSMNNGGQS